MYSKALEILKKHWGFDSFRPTQDKIIKAILNKQHTIALLPTGGGKSLCYQIPTLCTEGTCVVISPLIALMEDQVNSLISKGIKATLIPSGSTQDQIITLFDNIRFGNYKFLYISPERLQSKFIQEKIKQLNVNLIAIDEAHCISEWGHDFRPSYRNITILKELKPQTPIVAVTATATKKVLNDVQQILALQNPVIFKQSFYRKNLAYQIFYTEDKLYKLKQIFIKTKAPAIIYVNSRSKTKEISSYLNANGFESTYYHAGLTAIEKQNAFTNWLHEKKPIIVATNAFGMGIDKANVKVLIHLNLPTSIENYTQEAGRAGRNNSKAFSVVLTSKADIELSKELENKSLPTLNDIKIIHQKLYQYYQISTGEFSDNIYSFNLLDFSNTYNFIPNKVYTTIQLLVSNGIIQLDTNYSQKSTVQLVVKPHTLNKENNLIQLLLRLYGGIFDQEIKIDEFYIAKKLNTTSFTVIEKLDKLAAQEVIIYNKANADSSLVFLVPREDNRTINTIAKNIKTYLNQKIKKRQDLVKFINNNEVCRAQQLLHYFNEESSIKCEICDVCLKNKPQTITQEAILTLLRKEKALSSKEICAYFNETETNILTILRLLLAEELIKMNSQNKYTLL